MVWNYWMEAAELAHKLLLKNLLRALKCFFAAICYY
jgi:hypothetical protein